MLAGFLYKMHRQESTTKTYTSAISSTRRMVREDTTFRLSIRTMKFGVFLTQQQRLINLQRLSCSAAAYIYILEQYARLAHIDPSTYNSKDLLRD